MAYYAVEVLGDYFPKCCFYVFLPPCNISNSNKRKRFRILICFSYTRIFDGDGVQLHRCPAADVSRQAADDARKHDLPRDDRRRRVTRNQHYSPAGVVQIIKSISAKVVFKEFSEVKKQLWRGEFWSDGYFVRSVGDKVTSEVIRRYIKYQHHEQLSFVF